LCSLSEEEKKDSPAKTEETGGGDRSAKESVGGTDKRIGAKGRESVLWGVVGRERLIGPLGKCKNTVEAKRIERPLRIQLESRGGGKKMREGGRRMAVRKKWKAPIWET